MKLEDQEKLLRLLIESDAAFESDCILVDLKQERPVTKREETLAKLVSQLYKIIHPSNECRHENWEQENLELLKQLN